MQYSTIRLKQILGKKCTHCQLSCTYVEDFSLDHTLSSTFKGASSLLQSLILKLCESYHFKENDYRTKNFSGSEKVRHWLLVTQPYTPLLSNYGSTFHRYTNYH